MFLLERLNQFTKPYIDLRRCDACRVEVGDSTMMTCVVADINRV